MTDFKGRLLKIFKCTVMIVLSAFAITGCSGKPVLFNTMDSGLRSEVVYRVFFDREGNIYPDTNDKNFVGIDTNEFSKGAGNGYLQRYYCKHPLELQQVAKQAGITDYEQYRCELEKNSKEGYSGAIKYGKFSEQDSWLNQWKDIQESLLDKYSLEITEELKKEKNIDSALFVLIHGYNNNLNSIKEAYEEVRISLKNNKKYENMKFVFLDIYWDGSLQSVPINIWGAAQYTGPLIGVKIRKLLKDVEPTRSVRILTHSSGAFVVGSLIGDSRKALPLWNDKNICKKGKAGYDQATCHYKNVMLLPCSDIESEYNLDDYGIIQSKNIRVGMIAPATSALTFTGGDTTGIVRGRGILQPSGKLRLIVGQHQDDFATTKLLGLEGGKGATTLGVRKSSFCEIQTHVADKRKLNEHIDVHRVDFKSDGKEPYPKFLFRADHALKAYLKRDNAPEFWSLLLDADTVPSSNSIRSDNNCSNNI